MLKIPKISCLTVTKNRFDLLINSISCYRNQSYSNKQLVIVSQSDPYTNSLIEDYTKDQSDIIFVTASESKSLGALRNLSIELATGELLCQWDDDDISHPHRLATQYSTLDNNTVACLYTQHLKYFTETNELYWIDWSQEKSLSSRYLPGTVMFRKKIYSKFRGVFYPEYGRQSNKEEDMCALNKLIQSGAIADVNQGYQYIYVYHGKNVYDIKHHQLVLDKVVMNAIDLQKKSRLINETLKAGNFSTVNVRSLEERAFVYARETN